MKPSFARRYRRRSPSRAENMFAKKDKQSLFSAEGPQPFFQPVIGLQSSQSIQAKSEDSEKEEKKVTRVEDKKEEETNVMRAEEEQEEEVQRQKDQKEEEEVQAKKDKEEEDKVQKKENANTSSPTGNVTHYIGSLYGKGQNLAPESNHFFSARMGYDFSNVKVHTDKQAAESAKEINAKAYTTGNNIVFNEGQYDTGSAEGKKLMAHELTHVIQQNPDKTGKKPKSS